MANKKNSKSNKKSKGRRGRKRSRSAYILFTIEKRPQVKVIISTTNLNIFLKSNICFRVKIQVYLQKKFYQNLLLYGKLLILKYLFEFLRIYFDSFFLYFRQNNVFKNYLILKKVKINKNQRVIIKIKKVNKINQWMLIHHNKKLFI
jgi:hypothetical protein